MLWEHVAAGFEPVLPTDNFLPAETTIMEFPGTNCHMVDGGAVHQKIKQACFYHFFGLFG